MNDKDGGIVDYTFRQRCMLWLYSFVCPAADRFAAILRNIASPEEIFDAPPDELRRIVGEDTLNGMRRHNTQQYIDGMLEKLEQRGITFICRGDDEYPECFDQLEDIVVPPQVLFVRGSRDIAPGRAIAIVGTRSCTPDGDKIAHMFARDFARVGAAVVSGMAVGIDGAALEGALDAGGRTIGVLGCGVDVPYPAQNQALAARMLENGGSLISEYLPGTSAMPRNFPVRNRIIAALAAGTVVIQAPKRSGSLNTASHALVMGRDVFVVPGSILDARYEGSNALLRDGAIPALCSADVLELLGFRQLGETAAYDEGGSAAADVPVSGLNDDELRLTILLREREHSFDEIVSETGFDTAKLNSLLTMLKIKGIIYESAGKRYGIKK